MIDNKVTLEHKLSNLFKQTTPNVVQEEYPLFLQFLKYYYEFLETGELTVNADFSTLALETNTSNQVINQDGSLFLTEDSNIFRVGETVTGSTSKATSTVVLEKIINDNKIFIRANQRFMVGETITGSTSGATATVVSYRGNPVQNIHQLIDYVDVDETVDEFLKRFRDMYLQTIPENLVEGIDKRKLTKNIKNLYEAKGTKRGHEYFFRILFGQDVTVEYPREKILKPSDGKWVKNKVIRLTAVGESNANEMVGEKITGKTTNATAVVETVIIFSEGQDTVIEAVIDDNLSTGTFSVGEEVTAISNVTDRFVTFTVKGIITGATITESGHNYNVEDEIDIASAGNGFAKLQVGLIGDGGIDNYLIDDGGSGYAIGDELNFNEDDTNGTGAEARVRVVGGSFAMEDEFQSFTGDGSTTVFKLNREVTEYQVQIELNSVVQSSGFTVSGTNLTFTSAPANLDDIKVTYTDTQYMKLESGSESFYGDTYLGTDIVLEEETVNSLDGASEVGKITKVRVIKRGKNYNKLPLVSSITTSGGSGASILTISTSGVGSVKQIDPKNFGLNYTSAPAIYFDKNFRLKDVTGTFAKDNTLTTHTGTVVSYDSDRQILIVDSTDDFVVGDTITDINGATATIAIDNTASGTSSVGYLGNESGKFINEKGRVSNPSNFLQDNRFYQDFSYVVKVDQSTDKWRSLLKNSIHPAGWNLFGQLTTSTLVSAKIKSITGSEVSDNTSSETFTPELASTFDAIIQTVFARRLGTDTDGTTLNSTPQVGYDSPSDVPSSKRELTLSSTVKLKIGTTGSISSTGHTLDLLAKYAFARGETAETDVANYPGIDRVKSDLVNAKSGYTIEQFANFRINQVSTEGTGEIPESAYTTTINVPPPSTVNIIRTPARTTTFDSTVTTFDDGTITFDTL